MTPLNGVTAELRAVSGSINSAVEHRLEGGRGYWRSVVGDGRAVFKVNSTSGGLRILAARPGDAVVAAAAPARASTPPSSGPDEGVDTGPAPTAVGAAEGSGPQETEESWSPDEAGAPGENEAEDAAEDQELAVLQALERGEIGVDEAAERLDRSRR